MTLDKINVPEEENENFDLKTFNTRYLIKNRPVKVKGMANKWDAIKRWDMDYLKARVGFSTSMTAVIYRKDN